MSEDFIVHAETRTVQGTGASRRLRRSGRVPAILYGGASEPVQLSIDHNEMLRHLEHEAFYSHILSIDVDGKTENAVLKDLQRHPAKAQILHADFMRVVAGQAMRMTVPLHFVGEDTSPGIKNSGGVLDRQRNERAAKDQEQDRRIIRAGGLLRVHDPRERQDEERHQRRCGEGERLGYPPGGHQDDQPRNDEPFARKTFGQRPENCREQCYYAQRKADRSRHIPLPRPVIGNRMERARGR